MSMIEMLCQEDYKISPVMPLRTSVSEFACSMIGSDLIFARMMAGDPIDDHGPGRKRSFQLMRAEMGDQFHQMSGAEAMSLPYAPNDVGTAYFSPSDSVLWFSSANNYGRQKGKTLKIYSVRITDDGWEELRAFQYNSTFHSMSHPWIDETRDQLFFSSDKPGGSGGMDLWFCNRYGTGWAEPIWLGAGINTEANEIFPTSWKGDIYYSSDKNGELNLYVSTLLSQWSDSEELPEPLNSSGDDFQMIFIDDAKGFVSSNRDSFGAFDDIFFFESAPNETMEFTALLECLGTPIRGAEVTFLNNFGEKVLVGKSSELGKFLLKDLEFNESYRVQTSGIPEAILKDAYLYVLNDEGLRIKAFKLGLDGGFNFEMLPRDELTGISELDNTDESVLSLRLQGHIYTEEPGDVGAGAIVYVTSKEGELLAMTYTSHRGKFSFEEVRPLQHYQFRVDPKLGNVQMVLNTDQDSISVSVEEGAGSFMRLGDDQVIRLVDEFDRPIEIGGDEIFILRNIYYQFDSTRLNVIAQEQLANMAHILKKNNGIGIQLSSHTDSRGELEYNQELSDSRALMATEFLISKGVEGSRLSWQGFGESKLLNHCVDGVECTEEMHAVNRRTEIQITTRDD
jgi:outer membrane protein OmpA-like peptidoglycan-associated protein